MIIYKRLTNSNFTKFDNNILRIHRDELLDGAKILYCFLSSFQNGKPITYGYISKSLGYSKDTIGKYIRQLKGLDLILMARTGAKSYSCFIGSTQIGASVVADFWKELKEEDAENPYTLDDLMRIREEHREL